ncbi:uncharacterized protein MKZ38_002670 [Zalerion maritima]|uniref:Rhodopsin domain-containing protein n=1 Tax=Zalerion maritima TaxID=339359 RepID=A0AAD5RPY3_9PEZI|nr:uncharacterized protein MKZ38_002670 [Zalerion maritima]
MDDNGPRLRISVWVLLSLATIFMAARFYAKIARGRGLWWDDHIMLASWCMILIDVICITSLVALGIGRHQWDLPDMTASESVKFNLLSALSGTFSILATVWSKTSFAVTLLRITEGKTKMGIWAAIVSMNLFMGGSVLLTWIHCQPMEKVLKPWVEGQCWDTFKVTKYHIFSGEGCLTEGRALTGGNAGRTAYSAAADIILSILPWFLVMHLQMKLKEKLGVGVAMSLGLFAGATGVVKCAQLPQLWSQDFSCKLLRLPLLLLLPPPARAALTRQPANYYDCYLPFLPADVGANLQIWGVAEPAVTVVAASIPVLRVFFRDVQSSFNKYYGSPGGGRSGSASRHHTGTRTRTRTNGRTRLQDGNNTLVVGGDDARRSENRIDRYAVGGGSKTRKGGGGDDDGSEKSILGGPGKIVKTEEIAVVWKDKDDEGTETEGGSMHTGGDGMSGRMVGRRSGEGSGGGNPGAGYEMKRLDS